MTKVSRIPIEPEHMGRFINNLWSAIALLENKEEVKRFLRDILSHTETKMLAKRLQIAKMLLEEKPYQVIKTHVRVQNTTVAKINNILNTSKGDGLRKTVEKLIAIEKKKKEKMEKPRRRKRGLDYYDTAAAVVQELEKAARKRKKRTSAEKSLPYSFGALK